MLIGGAGQDVLHGGAGDDVIDGVTGEETATLDYLNGGAGNDTLIGNAGDILSGGTGADIFAMDATQGSMTVMDYDAADDTLVVLYNGAEPILSTELTEGGLILLADGTEVATLGGIETLDLATVQMVAT